MTTNEHGKDIVVGGYEYRIFDAISKKLKCVGSHKECRNVFDYLPLVLAVSNMRYLYQNYAACGVIL